MEEPLFMFQLIIAVDVSEHRSIYNKLNAPCSGDFNSCNHVLCIFKQAFFTKSVNQIKSKVYFGLLRNDIDLLIISHWNKHLFVGTGKMTTPIYQ